MIGYLKGNLVKKSPNQIILDVGGVGYSVWIPLSTYLELKDTDEPAELLVYTHLTENSLALYGFSREQEKDLFLKLIGISGIGPKLALNILSGIEVSDLEEAIQQSDITRITLIPGIGKKTALRIALELQEKLEKKEEIIQTKALQEREDLISALMNLGFKRKEVERIVDDTVRNFTPEAGFEQLLRESLKKLAKI